MLNIVQDSALLESIGAQTETVRLRSLLLCTDKRLTFYNGRGSVMDITWMDITLLDITGRKVCCVFVGEYRWEPHDSEESESQPYQQWH